MVAASLTVSTFASAVRIDAPRPAWSPFCPHHPPIVVVVGCERGFMRIPAGVKEITLTIQNIGGHQVPGCPDWEQAASVNANVYGRRAGSYVPVATTQGRVYTRPLGSDETETITLKWIRGRSRTGDEGVVNVAGVSCRIIVE